MNLREREVYLLKEYMKKYDVFSGRSLQQIQCKLQKTLPGQGFHYWHYEQTPFFGARQITTQLYLNDDFKGGSTMFEDIEVKPEAGKLIIFSNSQHLHYVSKVEEAERFVLSFWYSRP